MRIIALAFLLLIYTLTSNAQRFMSLQDAKALAMHIDTMTSVKTFYDTLYSCSPNGMRREDSNAFSFVYDSVSNKLLKVTATNIPTKKSLVYYYQNDRMALKRGELGLWIFDDSAYSFGSTYKDAKSAEYGKEKDVEIARSYKFLLYFNRWMNK